MTNKYKSRILPAVLFLVVIAVLAVLFVPRFQNRSSVVQSLWTSPKDKEIAELNALMTKNPNKDSQEYQEARKKFCLITARSAKEREKAVANIRKILGMPDVQVDFLCSGFGNKPNDAGTDYNNPVREYYEAALYGVTIDPKTNYIIEVGEAERRGGYKADGTRWSDPMPEYDYTLRYNTVAEVQKVAEKFMTDHLDILGFDISKLKTEYEGTKPGNYFFKWEDYEHGFTKETELCGNLGEGSVDSTYEGAYQNAEGVWCVRRTSTNYPLVSITITTGGQVIRYDNDTYDLEKL